MATPADYERLGGWAGVLNTDLGIDRRGSQRTVPMRVLHLAFPRTGTMSMQKAYEMLGFASPFHFASLFDNVRDIDLWLEAFQAKERGTDSPEQWRARFDELVGHCSVLTDALCVSFWPELLMAYPDAKVVLVERDPQKWESSFVTVLDALNPMGYVLRITDPSFSGRFHRITCAWTKQLLGSSNATQARKNLLDSYVKHYAQVRAAVPADKRLEYELGSGWEPLCKYLEVPVPDKKFPHKNESAVLKESLALYFKRAGKNSLFNLSLAIGALAVVAGFVWPKAREAYL